jgi:hypothetical protein
MLTVQSFGATRCAGKMWKTFVAEHGAEIKALSSCSDPVARDYVATMQRMSTASLCLSASDEQKQLALLALIKKACAPVQVCPVCKSCPACPPQRACPDCPTCPVCREPVAPGAAQEETAAPLAPAPEPSKWGVNLGWLLAGAVVGVGGYVLFKKKGR